MATAIDIQAEAFTVGTHEEQDGFLPDVISGYYSTPAEIKDRLICEMPTLAMAIFPKEEYSGDYTTDLFGKAETTYFNDAAGLLYQSSLTCCKISSCSS